MNEGILLINKPAGITSFDCIRRLKPFFPKKTKIGHTGTLDPFATGLMIICIGRSATKLVPAFHLYTKRYIATGELCRLTTTLDPTGAPLPARDIEAPSLITIERALKQLTPSYEQTPPAFSALKVRGTPLYKKARAENAKTEELAALCKEKTRTVHISDVVINGYRFPRFTVALSVSSGTYIRSVLDDAAQHLGTNATTVALHRSEIGPWKSSHALDLEGITNEQIEQSLIPVDSVEQVLATLDA